MRFLITQILKIGTIRDPSDSEQAKQIQFNRIKN
jgi:hypothetical protein